MIYLAFLGLLFIIGAIGVERCDEIRQSVNGPRFVFGLSLAFIVHVCDHIRIALVGNLIDKFGSINIALLLCFFTVIMISIGLIVSAAKPLLISTFIKRVKQSNNKKE